MTCAFTGPRNPPFLFMEGFSYYEDLRARLEKEITLLCEQGVTYFYCGMALGCDQLCAEIVLVLKPDFPDIQLHAAVPFRNYAIGWIPESQARYTDLLGRCDKITCLSEEYRKDCYLARNRWVVNQADCLLAVCNPESIPRRSGTGATVRYAQAQGKRIVFVPALAIAT